MKVKILLLFFLLALAACKSARVRKLTASEQIISLKDNFLLVRLNTGEVKANALAAAGRETTAASVREKQRLANLRIREAFAERFDFCPVFFFFADQSGLIREHRFDEVVFNHSGDSIDPDRLPGRSFLVAEFSRIRQSAGQSGMEALIVMDDSLRQMKNPFPFYIRTTFLGEDGMESKAVGLLNAQFYDYFAQSRIWLEKQERKRRRRDLRDELD